MSFFSNLGTAVGSGATGLLSTAFQSMMNRKQMKYQYELNQRSLRESPTAQKEGLISAGYNPMLAVTNGMQAPTVSGAPVSAPDLTSAYSKKKEGEAIDKQNERIDNLTDAEVEKLQAEAQAAMDHSGAAMYDAETRRMEAEARIKSLDAGTDKTNVNIGTDILNTVAPIAGAAASAYTVKKSTDLARAGLQRGMSVESAKKYAKDVTGKSPRVGSAFSGSKALKDFGLLAAPLLLGYGIEEGFKGRDTPVWKKNKKHFIRSLHGWH